MEEIEVGRLYATMNHWNQIEYSVGTPIMERASTHSCRISVTYRAGILRRHTIQQIGNP
jgi:hypothetical protein